MQRRTAALLGGAIALAIGAACAGGDSPERAARAFWEAIAAGDRAAAAELVTRDSRRWIDAPGLPEATGRVLFGEPLRNDRAAIVRTSMTTRDGDVELDIVFDTHLAIEEDRWKVDLGATRNDVGRAVFAAGMRRIGETVGEGVRELSEAIERGVEQMREGLGEGLGDGGPRAR